jgi:hypothetical protein
MAACRSGKPSEKERWNKINAARKLIEDQDWEAANPGKLDHDLRELEETFGTEWATDEDKLVLFRAALSEIRAEHYCETRNEPEVSRVLGTADLEMWKFKWQSQKDCFGKCVMYIKFSIKGTGEKGPLYIHSLHIDHPPSKE